MSSRRPPPRPAERAAGKAPKTGGSAVFALEAETSGGYCLPDAILAASGIQVINAIYDTLVTLNSKGKYVPYLAKTVEPNPDYTEWTITLREGIEFHNGQPLDAEAVKLNIDTYRGDNPNIRPRLNVFVLQDVESVDVTGPLEVTVTLKRPWVSFPAFLWNTGRFGIVAPAQLADRETCATQPIGTGPFKFVEWRVNDFLEVERNPDYWQEGFPYLDRITFKPVPEGSARVNGLVSGEFDLMTTSNSLSIIDLQEKAKAGDINVVASDKGAETAYLMLNTSKPPFDDPIARAAIWYGGNPGGSERDPEQGAQHARERAVPARQPRLPREPPARAEPQASAKPRAGVRAHARRAARVRVPHEPRARHRGHRAARQGAGE